MKPKQLSGFFKVGSAWEIGLTRKDSAGAGVDLSDTAARATFRAGSVDGEILLTLDDGPGTPLTSGITLSETVDGRVDILLMPADTATFPVGIPVYFDLELTPNDGMVWQSPTYYLVAEQEVTKP